MQLGSACLVKRHWPHILSLTPILGGSEQQGECVLTPVGGLSAQMVREGHLAALPTPHWTHVPMYTFPSTEHSVNVLY